MEINLQKLKLINLENFRKSSLMDSRTGSQKGRSKQWDDTDSGARSGDKQKAHKENLENGKG